MEGQQNAKYMKSFISFVSHVIACDCLISYIKELHMHKLININSYVIN